MIPNLRDVGKTINMIVDNEIIKEGVLFRSGTINEIFSENELPNVKYILNLRKVPDIECKRVTIQVPAVDSVKNYSTKEEAVRNWINRALSAVFKNENIPILIHCTAGKDRTGVIIAAILLCMDFPINVIIDEYMFSDGLKGNENIKEAISGFGEMNDYLYDSSIIKKIKDSLLV